jgi:hypothetical protein
MVLAPLQVPPGAPLSLRSLSRFLQLPSLRSGSSCVLHPSSFIPSCVPLHSTRSPLSILLQGMAALAITHKQYYKACTYISAKPSCMLAGFHCAPLRRSFAQKGSVHPLPILVLACAAAGCVPGLHCHNTYAYALDRWHSPLTKGMPRSAPPLCAHCSLAVAFLCAPAGSARSRFRSALPCCKSIRKRASLQRL